MIAVSYTHLDVYKRQELRFFREFSYKEIADQLNLPIGTVKTQIHRAREQLCRYITDHNDRQL